jgi:carboxyl-terminal processing protease
MLSGLAVCSADLTPAQRLLHVQSFDHVWNTVRESHWDPKLGGVDWQAVRDELRPRLEKATTRDEARDILSAMLRRLKQSHYAILPADVYDAIESRPAGREAAQPPEERHRPGMGNGRIGFDVRVIGGQALVTKVDNDTTAWNIGVRPGWQLLEVDGMDMALVITHIQEAYKDSSLREFVLIRAMQAKLGCDPGEKLRTVFVDSAGARTPLEISCFRPRGTPAKFGFLPPQHVWFESRKLESNAGYIAFNLFLDPARLMASFQKALEEFAAAGGVVIDLRGNPGGIGIMAMGMAGWFIDKPDQQLGTMFMRQTPLKFFVNPRLPHFGKPLAILVDGASASTSEIFAGGMKDLGRARIFGSRTAGAALPSVIEKLPNGDGFQYAIANYVSDSGRTLEGAGVEPDTVVTHTRETLLAGRDAVLDAAVAWIQRR